MIQVPKRFVKPTHLFLIGRPKSGKSTVAQFLAELEHLNQILGPWGKCPKLKDTSDIIYKELAKERGVSVKKLRKIPKEKLRPALVAKGNELCKEDPAYLVGVLLRSGQRIIPGIRRRHELKEVISRLRWAGFRPLVIWIDRKTEDIKDNTEVTREDADLVFDNTGHSKTLLMVKCGKFLEELSRNPVSGFKKDYFLP